MSHQEPGTASHGPPGPGPTDAADSTSATLLAAGNPNPFWSEMAQAEFRLLAARPDFLGNETVEGRMVEQADATAWRLPVRDDTSIVDEHPPDDAEPENPGGTPVKHTAAGDMIRRTMNAAPRKSEMDQATVPDALNTNRVGTQAHNGGSDAAEGSPVGSVFQQRV